MTNGERRLHEEPAQETADMVQKTNAMLGEVSKVLQVQRWTVQREPFAGFRSPPGRF
ncbi:MAG: hypothetical protein Q7T33_11375 [Dehalococcoidia bacterium]|nr:hypothetical protein [Dehalococcoidia bacterium]